MFSKKKTNKTVISLTDSELSYITLDHNERGFFIDSHETIELPEGTIVHGEILKADLLYRILKKLTRKIKSPSVDVLLPHDYFLCADGVLDEDHKKEPLKKRVTRYFEETVKEESWHKTHVCEFSLHKINDKDAILFTCLPSDIQKSYVHVFNKSGMKIESINSNVLAFDHLLGKESTSLVAVDRDTICVTKFKNRMYHSHETFQVSYNHLIQDIKNNLKVSENTAKDIFSKFGILRAHKDEKIYKQLIKSISPLLRSMSQEKINDKSRLSVVFFDAPILGLVDIFKKTLNVETNELDVFRTNNFTFQDILSIHRDESYKYQSLIAQALKFWEN